jgi:hypothetical protein
MYKSIFVVAVLLAAFAFLSGSRSADASQTVLPSPVIVAKGRLANQTAPIPTTTMITPTQNGLYRWSVYATIATADPNSNSNWDVNLFWTDDAAPQGVNSILVGPNKTATQFEQGNAYGANAELGGPVTVFEAKAGQPITYSVTLYGPVDNSAYSLYYTLERLE